VAHRMAHGNPGVTMTRHKLTDAECKAATSDKQDGAGLYLKVDGGSKSWVYRYQLRKKRTKVWTCHVFMPPQVLV